MPPMSDASGLPSWFTNTMTAFGLLKVSELVKWAWDRREKKKEAEKQAQAAKDKLIQEALQEWFGCARSLMKLQIDMCNFLWCEDNGDHHLQQGNYEDHRNNLRVIESLYAHAEVKLLALHPKSDLAERVERVGACLQNHGLPLVVDEPGQNCTDSISHHLTALKDLEREIKAIRIKGNK